MTTFPLQLPRRITGTVPFAGLPLPWRVVTEGPDLLMVSNEAQVRRSAWAIAAVMVAGYAAFALVEYTYQRLQLTLPQIVGVAILALLTIVVVVAFLISRAKRETARGPWLIWRGREQTLELPRQGMTLKREQVVSLDLVVATTWKTARPHSSEYPIAEFQIVFKEDGERKFVAVVGAQHARFQSGPTLTRDIAEMSRAMGVPMERVEIP